MGTLRAFRRRVLLPLIPSGCWRVYVTLPVGIMQTRGLTCGISFDHQMLAPTYASVASLVSRAIGMVCWLSNRERMIPMTQVLISVLPHEWTSPLGGCRQASSMR